MAVECASTGFSFSLNEHGVFAVNIVQWRHYHLIWQAEGVEHPILFVDTEVPFTFLARASPAISPDFAHCHMRTARVISIKFSWPGSLVNHPNIRVTAS